MAWLIAGTATVAAVCLGLLFSRQELGPTQVLYSFLPPPEKTAYQFNGDVGMPPELAPDGSAVVFGAGGSLWVRSLLDGTIRALAGTEGASFPFWAPDSQRIGFFGAGKLKTLDKGGGALFTVCDVQAARGGTWTREGVIVMTPNTRAGIFRVPANGGTPTEIVKVDQSRYTTGRWPVALPDGKHFLYLAVNHSNQQSEGAGIYYASVDGKENRFLLHTYVSAAYAPGYLLFLRDNTLLAQRFDAERGTLSSDPVKIAQGVGFDLGIWRAMLSVSQNGRLVYMEGAGGAKSRIAWFDRTGKEVHALDDKSTNHTLQLSHDGKKLAIVAGEPGDIWIYNLTSKAKSRLTFSGSVYSQPVWSPDDRRIAYTVMKQRNRSAIYAKPADGSSQETLLQESDDLLVPVDWSPDGQHLVESQMDRKGDSTIWVVPLSGDRKRVAVPLPSVTTTDGRVSPDGRWIAHTSLDTGSDQVYVTSFPDAVGRWQISTLGGRLPRWRRDGKELFLTALDGTVMSAEVRLGETFYAGPLRPLFRMNLASANRSNVMGFDVTADGQRFLGILEEERISSPLTLVTNWTAELKKK